MRRTCPRGQAHGRSRRFVLSAAGVVRVVLVLLVVPGALAQPSGDVQPGPGVAGAPISNPVDVLSYLSVAVAILTGAAAIAIAVSGIGTLLQMRRIDRLGDRLKQEVDRYAGKADDADKKMLTMDQRVKDYESPKSILSDAGKASEVYCDREMKALRDFIDGHRDDLNERLRKLEESIRSDRPWHDTIRQDLQSLALEVKEKPSINDVTVAIGKQYDTPVELKLLLLTQTRNAFDCLKDLSQEEQLCINQALAIGAGGAGGEGLDRSQDGEA